MHAVVNEALKDRLVPIDSVKPHPKNYNHHRLDKISESLRENGQYRPLVVEHDTGYILAGNGTWRAAKQLGWSEIAADRVVVTSDVAKRILLVDNHAASDDYDEQTVKELLDELGDLSGTGIDAEDFASLLKRLEPDEEDEDLDASEKLTGASVFAVVVECDDEFSQAELLARFEDEGLKCRALTT